MATHTEEPEQVTLVSGAEQPAPPAQEVLQGHGGKGRRIHQDYVVSPDAEREVRELRRELARTNEAIEAVRKEAMPDAKLQRILEPIQESVKRALEQTNGMSAKVILPTDDEMAVRLVPLQQVERIEEYRGDQSIFFTLVGLFGGAVLGILSNWATLQAFTMTRASLVLSALFLLLCILCGVWTVVIGRRATKAKRQMPQWPRTPDLLEAAESPDCEVGVVEAGAGSQAPAAESSGKTGNAATGGRSG
jgi:hypothetical protein